MKCPKIAESEREAAMGTFADLLIPFKIAARNDLGVHPQLHTHEEWEQIISTEKPWWRFWQR